MSATFNLSDLEKLEVLYAVATPGEWKGDRKDGTVKYRMFSQECECVELWECPHVVLDVDHKNGTSGFRGLLGEENEKLVKALHSAFPEMAKALREAWAARDEAIRQGDERLAEIYDEKTACVKQLRHERDSARQELANIDRNIRTTVRQILDLEKERDEALAEVERCRRISIAQVGVIGRHHEKIEKLQDMLQRACKAELEWKVAAIGAEVERDELRGKLNAKDEGDEP